MYIGSETCHDETLWNIHCRSTRSMIVVRKFCELAHPSSFGDNHSIHPFLLYKNIPGTCHGPGRWPPHLIMFQEESEWSFSRHCNFFSIKNTAYQRTVESQGTCVAPTNWPNTREPKVGGGHVLTLAARSSGPSLSRCCGEFPYSYQLHI